MENVEIRAVLAMVRIVAGTAVFLLPPKVAAELLTDEFRVAVRQAIRDAAQNVRNQAVDDSANRELALVRLRDTIAAKLVRADEIEALAVEPTEPGV